MPKGFAQSQGMKSKCVIRKLVWSHTLIDEYPENLFMDYMSAKTAGGSSGSCSSSYQSSSCLDHHSSCRSSSSSSDDDDDGDDEEESVSEPDDLDDSTHSVHSAPQACSTFSGAMEEQRQQQFNKFGRREDQDVFVFREIMKQMPPNVLLRLLGQAEQALKVDEDNEEGPTQSYVQVYKSKGDAGTTTPNTAAVLSLSKTSNSSCSATDATSVSEDATDTEGGIALDSPTPQQQRQQPLRKRVRFERDERGQIAVRVTKFENLNSPTMWWTRQDLEGIRAECRSIVRHYISKIPDYADVVIQLLEVSRLQDPASQPPASRMSKSNLTAQMRVIMKKLIVHYDARGLEQHIVERQRNLCFRHVSGVVREARKAYSDPVDHAAAIRRVSIKSSVPGVYLARRLADCDRLLSQKECQQQEPGRRLARSGSSKSLKEFDLMGSAEADSTIASKRQNRYRRQQDIAVAPIPGVIGKPKLVLKTKRSVRSSANTSMFDGISSRKKTKKTKSRRERKEAPAPGDRETVPVAGHSSSAARSTRALPIRLTKSCHSSHAVMMMAAASRDDSVLPSTLSSSSSMWFKKRRCNDTDNSDPAAATTSSKRLPSSRQSLLGRLMQVRSWGMKVGGSGRGTSSPRERKQHVAAN